MNTAQGPQFVTSYDPLATQFMTGGQMGYMPQAQYLTAPNYGAFRTLPPPRMSTNVYQQPSLWQSYLYSTQGGPFGTAPYFFDAYNPAASQMQTQIMAGRRVQDSMWGMGGAAADTAIWGTLGTIAGGPIGGVLASMFAPSVSAPFMDRIRGSRGVQQLTMNKVFGGMGGMSPGLGYGFGGGAAYDIDASIRSLGARDTIFKDGDFREMMRLGVESGMFDYAGNAQQYKDTIKKLRSNFKIMMEVYETADFKELSGHMRRLQTMGANLSDMGGISRAEGMYSRMVGLSYQDTVAAYGQPGALTYSQAGLTPYQGSLSSMSHAAGVTIAQRLGLLSPGELARAGGISGLTQRRTAEEAGSFNQIKDLLLAFAANKDMSGIDSGKLQGLLSGRIDLYSAMQQGGPRVSGTPGTMAKFIANNANLTQQMVDMLGPEGMQLMQMRQAMALGRNFGATPEEQMLSGYSLMGKSPEEANQLTKYWRNPRAIEMQMEAMRTEQRRMGSDARAEYLRNNQLLRRWMVGISSSANQILEAAYEPFGERWARNDEMRERERTGVGGAYTGGWGNSAKSMSEDQMGRIGGAAPVLTGDYRQVARMSEGNDPLAISKDSRGYSYGRLQLNSGSAGGGTIGAFVRQSKWADRFAGLEVDSDAFKQRFRSLADDPTEGKAFQAAQEDFVDQRNFQPMLETLRREGFGELLSRGPIVQNKLYSIAVQYGPKMGASLVIKSLSGKDWAAMDDYKITQEISGLARTGIYFDPKYRGIVVARQDKEQRYLGGMTASHNVVGGGAGAEHWGTVAGATEQASASAIEKLSKAGLSLGSIRSMVNKSVRSADSLADDKLTDIVAEELRVRKNMSAGSAREQARELLTNADVKQAIAGEAFSLRPELRAAAMDKSAQASKGAYAMDAEELEKQYKSLTKSMLSGDLTILGVSNKSDLSLMQNTSSKHVNSVNITALQKLALQYGDKRNSEETNTDIRRQMIVLGHEIGLSEDDLRQIWNTGRISGALIKKIQKSTGLSESEISGLIQLGERAHASHTAVDPKDTYATMRGVTAFKERVGAANVYGIRQGMGQALKGSGLSLAQLRNPEKVKEALANTQREANPQLYSLLSAADSMHQRGEYSDAKLNQQMAGIFNADGSAPITPAPLKPEEQARSENINATLTQLAQVLTKLNNTLDGRNRAPVQETRPQQAGHYKVPEVDIPSHFGRSR